MVTLDGVYILTNVLIVNLIRSKKNLITIFQTNIETIIAQTKIRL